MKKLTLIICIILINIFLLISCFSSEGDINSDRNDLKNSEEIQFLPPEIGEEVAVINTDAGEIYIRLFRQYAPMAVDNFTYFAKEANYENAFASVHEDFSIQMNMPSESTMFNGNAYPVEISDSLHHYTGAVGVVKHSTEENSNKNSFYIIQTPKNSVPGSDAHSLTDQGMREEVADAYKAVGGAPYLDNEYTVFGHVFYGMDIVDKIANDPVYNNSSGEPDWPIFINSIEIVPYSEELTMPKER